MNRRDYPLREEHERIRGIAEDLGFEIVDLLPASETHAAEELWVHPSDQHPNQLGHEIAFEPILPAILDNLSRGPHRGVEESPGSRSRASVVAGRGAK